MLVRDILEMKGCVAGKSLIHGVSPESSVVQAIRIMSAHEVGSVVVREEERLLGLLTLREILAALDAQGGAALDVPVRDVMNSLPITGNPDDSVDYVRRMMAKNHVSHLPIMDGESLLGIVSSQDVAKAVYAEFSFENRLLKHYIRHWPEQPEYTEA